VALVPRRGVVLLRAPGATAPAAIGIFRPRIVLPAALDLGDDELEAILAHECAHVARRDNLLALIDAAIGAALWFHPLVWLARRILARAREDACDELVVGRRAPDVHLAALAKVCRAAAAPRVAGVSCIVSNTIRERMNAIMNLPLRRALPHRLVVAIAAALLATVTLVHAGEGKANRYTLQVGITLDPRNSDYIFDITVIDGVTNETVAHPHVQVAPGVPAELTTDGTPQFKIRALGEKNGHAEVSMQALDGNGNVIDAVKTSSTVVKAKAAAGISINLKDAELKDVVRTFGQLTGLETQVDADVEGKVSVEFRDVPWDFALQQILGVNGCEYQVEGKSLHVRRVR
jgi:BlaR1 peptidase M56